MWMQTNDPLSSTSGAWNCSSTSNLNGSSGTSSPFENCSLFALAGYSQRTRQAMILKSVCQRLVANDITTLELATSHDHFQYHPRNMYNDKNFSSTTTTTTSGTSRHDTTTTDPHHQQQQQQSQHQQSQVPPVQHRRGVLLVDEGSRLSCSQIKQLCKALRVNRSVQQACIGPKTVLTLRHLWMILEAIASIPTLTSLHLDLQTWIPEGMLRRILATCAAQSSIKSLQMTLTRVSSDHMPTTSTSSSKAVADYSSPASSSLWMGGPSHNWFFCLFAPGGTMSGGHGGGGGNGIGGFGGGGAGMGSGVGGMGLSSHVGGMGMGMGGGGPPSTFCHAGSPSSRTARYEYYFPQEVRMGNVFCTTPALLQHLTSLKLEYCGIRDEDIMQVCKNLVKNDWTLEELSLIGNRKISTRGIQAMFPSASSGGCTTTSSSYLNCGINNGSPLAKLHHQQQQQLQCQTPKILRLDLTDCDLTRDQFRVLVRGLVYQKEQQELEDAQTGVSTITTTTTLQELVVAWNHQLVNHDMDDDDDDDYDELHGDDGDTTYSRRQRYMIEDEDAFQHPLLMNSFLPNDNAVLQDLVQLFRTRKLLDISCCGVGPTEMNLIFPLLHDDAGGEEEEERGGQRLESLFIRGSRAYPTPGPALRDLIRNTSTLKHLQLLRTDAAYLMEEDDGTLLKYIEEGLETNYTLESLTVALPLPEEEDTAVDEDGFFTSDLMLHPTNGQRHEDMRQTWKTIQMYLALNRAGRRRILAPSPPEVETVTSKNNSDAMTAASSSFAGADDWAIVLGNVSDQLDCVYWLLRQGDPGILFP